MAETGGLCCADGLDGILSVWALLFSLLGLCTGFCGFLKTFTASYDRNFLRDPRCGVRDTFCIRLALVTYGKDPEFSSGYDL